MNQAVQTRPLVEVCAGSLADVDASIAAGADRIELCCALELGGLTPSVGLVRLALARANLPIVTMIRPRSGGFCYSDEEFQTVLADAGALLAVGVSGLVFGFLTREGQVDVDRCSELVRVAGECETVFHRAIDFTPDLTVAAKTLAQIGVTRVLTSGGAVDALAGALPIRAMREAVGSALQILPGGGVNLDNVERVLQETGCDQVHVGASTVLNDNSLTSERNIQLNDSRCTDGVRHRIVDPNLLQAIVKQAKASGGL